MDLTFGEGIYQLIIDSIKNYAIILLDKDGYIKTWNSGAEKMHGYTAKEAIGQHFSMFHTEEDLSNGKPSFELEVAEKIGHFHDESWRLKKNNFQFWANVVITSIRDPKTDELIGFTKVTQDLTERKRAEDDLRESEERYRLMVEGVRDYAIFMLNPQGIVSSWNLGAQRFKGYSAEEIIGKHFSVFYPEEDLEAKKPELEIKVAILTGRFEDEGWRIRKDGSRFWANVVITAIRNPQGELLGFTKVTRDLTERKSIENTLRESEERYRLMIEGVRDYAIFMLNPQGIVSSWNLGAQRFKGYRAEEIIGKHFSVFYPKEDLEAKKPELEIKVATKTGRFEDEGWRIRKDGSRFWANVVITAIRNPQGELLGFTKVTRDLTERRNAELAIKEVKTQLETTVEQLQETVKKLNKEVDLRRKTETELINKNILLEESNHDLEQFAYVASHDLKEPLRMIGIYSTLLINKCNNQDEELDLYKEFISNGVKQMQALIDGLLNYARINRSDIKMQPVNTQDILENVTFTLSDQIKTSGAEINVGKLPVVKGVESLIGNLFTNLLANAIKFRKPDENPVIEINATQAENKDQWMFSVSDNGIGIKKEYYNHIFAIFKRLHTKTEYEGTGIGLAISKRIVKYHNGKIWVESEPDAGSTFYFTLPK